MESHRARVLLAVKFMVYAMFLSALVAALALISWIDLCAYRLQLMPI